MKLPKMKTKRTTTKQILKNKIIIYCIALVVEFWFFREQCFIYDESKE